MACNGVLSVAAPASQPSLQNPIKNDHTEISLRPQGHAAVAGPATTTRAPPRPSTVVAAELEVAGAPDLTPAERARTCASLGVKHGAALSTQTDKLGGAALCTFAEYVLDGDGAPVLLLDARRAEHSKNLQADPRCSLLLQARDLDDRAAAVARVTIAGTATPVPKSAPDRVVLETQFGVRRGVELNRPAPSTRRWPCPFFNLVPRRSRTPTPTRSSRTGASISGVWSQAKYSMLVDLASGRRGSTKTITRRRSRTPWLTRPSGCARRQRRQARRDRSTIASTLLGLDDSEVRVDGVDRLG